MEKDISMQSKESQITKSVLVLSSEDENKSFNIARFHVQRKKLVVNYISTEETVSGRIVYKFEDMKKMPFIHKNSPKYIQFEAKGRKWLLLPFEDSYELYFLIIFWYFNAKKRIHSKEKQNLDVFQHEIYVLTKWCMTIERALFGLMPYLQKEEKESMNERLALMEKRGLVRIKDEKPCGCEKDFTILIDSLFNVGLDRLWALLYINRPTIYHYILRALGYEEGIEIPEDVSYRICRLSEDKKIKPHISGPLQQFDHDHVWSMLEEVQRKGFTKKESKFDFIICLKMLPNKLGYLRVLGREKHWNNRKAKHQFLIRSQEDLAYVITSVFSRYIEKIPNLVKVFRREENLNVQASYWKHLYERNVEKHLFEEETKNMEPIKICVEEASTEKVAADEPPAEIPSIKNDQVQEDKESQPELESPILPFYSRFLAGLMLWSAKNVGVALKLILIFLSILICWQFINAQLIFRAIIKENYQLIDSFIPSSEPPLVYIA